MGNTHRQVSTGIGRYVCTCVRVDLPVDTTKGILEKQVDLISLVVFFLRAAVIFLRDYEEKKPGDERERETRETVKTKGQRETPYFPIGK